MKIMKSFENWRYGLSFGPMGIMEIFGILWKIMKIHENWRYGLVFWAFRNHWNLSASMQTYENWNIWKSLEYLRFCGNLCKSMKIEGMGWSLKPMEIAEILKILWVSMKTHENWRCGFVFEIYGNHWNLRDSIHIYENPWKLKEANII